MITDLLRIRERRTQEARVVASRALTAWTDTFRFLKELKTETGVNTHPPIESDTTQAASLTTQLRSADYWAALKIRTIANGRRRDLLCGAEAALSARINVLNSALENARRAHEEVERRLSAMAKENEQRLYTEEKRKVDLLQETLPNQNPVLTGLKWGAFFLLVSVILMFIAGTPEQDPLLNLFANVFFLLALSFWLIVPIYHGIKLGLKKSALSAHIRAVRKELEAPRQALESEHITARNTLEAAERSGQKELPLLESALRRVTSDLALIGQ